MKKIQESAKNVQKAIDQGLKKLGVALEEVDVKILDEGGLFRKAKVELIYDDGKPEETVFEEKTAKKLEKKLEKKAEKITEKSEKKQTKIDKKEDKKTPENLEDLGVQYLEELCNKMNIKAKIFYERKQDGITFNAKGENVGPLIGKRGETLNAVQEILTNVAKKAGFKDEKIYFDVENYKVRREQSLESLADRMANKALKIGKPIRLERMNSYERKIIHTALQNMDGISTRSEGEDPNRYLVIIPNKRAEKIDKIESGETENIEVNEEEATAME